MPRSLAALLEDLAIETGRLLVRLDAQPALQDLPATAILAEGRGAHALGGIEAHELPVDVLAERLYAQGPSGRLDRLIQVVRALLLGQQLAQRAHRPVAVQIACRGKPILELRRFDTEAREELAGIEIARLAQCIRRPLGQQPIELHGVDGHRAIAQAHQLAFHVKQRQLELGEGPGQGEKHLAQTLPRALLIRIAPQKRGQRFARGRLARSQRQVGQQGLGLAQV